MDTLTLSRSKITSFLNCQRQFQLRYLEQIAWPSLPLSEQMETAVARGTRFHQLIEQSLNQLPIANRDPYLKRWWSRFENFASTLPKGAKLIETTMTIPFSLPITTQRTYLLNGRFDLLIIGHDIGQPFAHLFDWKTGRPKSESELRRDWQTRLYLAMLAEGGNALLPQGSQLHPHNILFTYWYVDEPNQPRTLQYSQSAHEENWRELQQVALQIDALDASQTWPLTDDLTQCRTCSYSIICHRHAETTVSQIDADDHEPLFRQELEPKRP
ncbi:MAG: PD-(D/E)XK nuclease family protein [Chloroflexota bacterium]